MVAAVAVGLVVIVAWLAGGAVAARLAGSGGPQAAQRPHCHEIPAVQIALAVARRRRSRP